MKTQLWKRLFALFLTFVMFTGVFPVQAFATETEHSHVEESIEQQTVTSEEAEVLSETETAAAESETETAVTEEVPETEAPVQTEETSETEAVLETEEIPETEAVVETEAVEETETVEETEEVEETEAVEETEEAEETEAVEETEEVEETEPEETMEEAISEEAMMADLDGAFLVGNVATDNFQDAITAAEQLSANIIVIEDATVPAGNYTIPAGVTLVVPFDAANTYYVETPEIVSGANPGHPTAYRTLTLAEGANLIVEGTMSVSAKQFAAKAMDLAGGMAYGTYGYVEMAEGSSITVKSGAKLSVYGYIDGEGTITAESGSHIYESFQFEDFRGGTMLDFMLDTSRPGVFPLSQYYVQNIMVPLTLKAGATEYSYASLATGDDLGIKAGSRVAFISSSGAMFNLTSGSVTKRYDKAADRLVISSQDAALTVDPLKMSISTYQIDSSTFALPINSNMTVQINGGSVTLNQDMALLPGAEIIVAEDAACYMGTGSSIYIYDADQWGGYVDEQNVKLRPAYFVPNREYTRTEADLVDARIVVEGMMDASKGYVYTTASGANVMGTEGASVKVVPGSAKETHQVVQAQDQLKSTYMPIPVTPAQLKNSDGTYQTTTSAGNYKYSHGFWHTIACGGSYTETDKKAASCEAEGYISYVCACGYTYTETLAKTAHREKVLPAVTATCQSAGKTEGKQCTVCGTITVAQKEIPTTAHKLDAGTVAVKATCTTLGQMVYKCTNSGCTYSETKEIAKTAHTEEILAAVDASCEKTGLSEGKKCTVCKEVTVPQTVIEKKPHTEEVLAAVPATCKDTGLTEGKQCSVCGTVTVKQEVVQLADHSYDAGKTTDEPRCEGTGVKTFTCMVCKATKTEILPATGHNDQIRPGSDPTCSADGKTDGAYCSVCHRVVQPQILPKLPHTEGEAVRENEKDATCTAEGSYDSVVYCTVCDAKISTVTLKIEKLAHTETAVAGKDATCTETGLTEGKKCSVCGVTTLEQSVIDALGHDYVETVTTAPDCENEGVRTVTCSRCDYNETEQMPALDHDKIYVAAKEPTCTEPGASSSATCSRCDYTEEAAEIPALEHSWNEGVVTTPATCTKDGEKTLTCGRCGTTKKEPVEKTAHTEIPVAGKAATCTGTGLTDGKQCSVCNTVTVEQQTIAALGHTHKTVLGMAATCTSTGKTDGVICAVCGLTITEQKEIAALGHTEDEGVVSTAPTCTGDGVKTFTCSVCGDQRTESLDSLGHTEETVPGYAATCDVDGREDGVKCSVCQVILTEQKVIPALDHTKGTPVREKEQAPTCTAAGSYEEAVYCTVCTEEITRTEKSIAALGHTKEAVEGKEPTCTETGLTAGEKCSVCEAVLTAQTVVPAKGHTEVVDAAVEPTCTETGKAAGKHCSVCSTVTVPQTEIPALGHTPAVDKAVEATCEKTGLTEGSHCAVCQTVITKQEEVKALGHAWGTGFVTTQPTCTETGIRSFTCSRCQAEKTEVEKALGHDLKRVPAKKPTYTEVGWEAYDICQRDGCGHSTMKVLETLGEPVIDNMADLIENLKILEDITDYYVKKVAPGKDPLALMIKYIRTGVDRYNSGSWNIMGGYEDAAFAAYVTEYENQHNAKLAEDKELMAVTGLKNIETFYMPNGDKLDIGHMFGTMDLSYTSSLNANVGGWAGDLCDLMSAADGIGMKATDVEGMVREMNDRVFLRERGDLEDQYGIAELEGSFSYSDLLGDIDAIYVLSKLNAATYENGDLAKVIGGYITNDLSVKDRASYFLKNVLGGVSLRADIRNAVYHIYAADGPVATLEGTRPFTVSGDALTKLRQAACYTFADYLCKLAGDWVEENENVYYNVYKSTSSNLAPGVTQVISYANTADGKQMVFYTATADITRDDLTVYVNCKDNDPPNWGMQRVLEQALAAQKNYQAADSDARVVAGINADGYDMANGKPSGIILMNGIEHNPNLKNGGFFGILEDGTAMIGTAAEYAQLKKDGKLREAVGEFGTPLIKDGKINITASGSYYEDRAGRTAIGITAAGKVVFMVCDGRQGEFSCGASMQEIAQIMLEAGCYDAINLDGGGSSTYIAKPEGEDNLRVVNSPSDGAPRSVASSLLMVSTAPSSDAFDHAVVESNFNYLTVGASAKVTAVAVSATGNGVEMPAGTSWQVSDTKIGTITKDGVFTAKALGKTTVHLMLDGKSVGKMDLNVVVPDNVGFAKDAIYGIYGTDVQLPVRAFYEGKTVGVLEKDITLTLENPQAGVIDGFVYRGNAELGLKVVKVIAALTADKSATAKLTITMYQKDEASFDFENATGGDRQLAWLREVSNSTEEAANTYRVKDSTKPMVTSYSFGIDMSQIEIPEQLADLTYMLPGADLEDASAWTFLMNLAERVSVVTYVRPVMKFDPNFTVDISNLNVANEYFTLTSAQLNQNTNELTLVLNFIDQTVPIDPATANPMCILTGIKLTPKAGTNWTGNRSVVNSGSIDYKVCLRTSTLYSFSQKEENQKVFGLYPYENPADPSDRGGSFSSTYKTFTDSYTLINSDKAGWVIEANGYAYYKDGQKVTGICLIDGFYYDFGTNGNNAGKTKYTGEMFEGGKEYYIKDGVKISGWMMQPEVRYYNPTTFVREKLTKTGREGTCVVKPSLTFTSESGAVRTPKYDDAGGHEYQLNAKGENECVVCGFIRIDMTACKTTLSTYTYTYNGSAKTPGATAVAPDGAVLVKPAQQAEKGYYDYFTKYYNNTDVGTAVAVLRANKPGLYVDMKSWRGNVAGQVILPYEIRPDLPTNIALKYVNETTATISWTASKTPGVTYVLYRSADGENWAEFATTAALSYNLDSQKDGGYVYRVGARKYVEAKDLKNDDGDFLIRIEGKNYDSVTMSATLYLAPIVTVTNNAADGKPVLTWPAVRNAKKYTVYRCNADGTGLTRMITTVKKTYTDTKAEAGTTYYYTVVALYDANGNSTSAYSKVAGTVCNLPAPVVSATNKYSTGKIVLSWEKVAGASKYEIYRSENEAGPYTRMLTTTKTSYTNTGAKTGKTYYYKVYALHASNAEANSDAVAVGKTCKLPRPVVTAGNSESSGKITLTWKAIEGAKAYKIYRATSKNGTYKLISTTTKTTFTNTSTTAGKTYYYRVRAVHESNAEADSSKSLVDSQRCVLGRPVVKLSSVASSGKIKISWKAIDGAEKYEVYRATSKNGTFKKISATTKTSYTDTSAQAGKTYYYKVKAIHEKSAANSAYSSVKSRTCDLARPVVSITLSSGDPKLTWKPVSGAVKYEVYRATSKTGTYKRIKTTTKTTYTNGTAKADTTYYYKVKAICSNTAANSAYSTIKSIKTK